MTYKLYRQVVINKDIPEKNLFRGDVATVVEHHPAQNGEDGYSLEVFNAVGDTIAVVTIAESAIQPLSSDEVFSVRKIPERELAGMNAGLVFAESPPEYETD
jgi:hypothetical protein